MKGETRRRQRRELTILKSRHRGASPRSDSRLRSLSTRPFICVLCKCLSRSPRSFDWIAAVFEFISTRFFAHPESIRRRAGKSLLPSRSVPASYFYIFALITLQSRSIEGTAPHCLCLSEINIHSKRYDLLRARIMLGPSHVCFIKLLLSSPHFPLFGPLNGQLLYFYYASAFATTINIVLVL
jgi:hypothetical protein